MHHVDGDGMVIFGVILVCCLQELEVLDHRMIGEPDLAVDLDRARLGLHALELDAVVELVNLDTVQHPEEIEVPPRAAEFAVGDSFRPTSSCFWMILLISRSSTSLSCAAVISFFSRLARASFTGAVRRMEPTWSARNGGLVLWAIDVLRILDGLVGACHSTSELRAVLCAAAHP